MRKILSTLFLMLIMSSLTLAQDDSPTPYEIALDRILDAEQSGTISLTLSLIGLIELPPEIGNLSNLRTLYLHASQLSSLPPEIGNLTDLQNLYLTSNDLSSLPSEIGNLSNLRNLYLAENDLRSLPPEFGNLSNLHELYLWSNELSSLPAEIGNLSTLQTLDLKFNDLSSLPDEIGNLTNLCILDIRHNQIRHLPASLGRLENLADPGCRLRLEGNPLISPPAEVIAQGTPAILDYLNNQAWWHLQRLIISIASGVGLLAIVIFGLYYRQRRNQRKPKTKRGDLS